MHEREGWGEGRRKGAKSLTYTNLINRKKNQIEDIT